MEKFFFLNKLLWFYFCLLSIRLVILVSNCYFYLEI
jgi:hypothetical protein